MIAFVFMQGEYLSRIWKIFIWDSWKIMVEWPKMHLLMQWMTSSQGSCINKSSFSPLVLMQILSIVSKPKLTRQVSCGLLKSVFYLLRLSFFHLEWAPTFGGFFSSEENINFSRSRENYFSTETSYCTTIFSDLDKKNFLNLFSIWVSY